MTIDKNNYTKHFIDNKKLNDNFAELINTSKLFRIQGVKGEFLKTSDNQLIKIDSVISIFKSFEKNNAKPNNLSELAQKLKKAEVDNNLAKIKLSTNGEVKARGFCYGLWNRIFSNSYKRALAFEKIENKFYVKPEEKSVSDKPIIENQNKLTPKQQAIKARALFEQASNNDNLMEKAPLLEESANLGNMDACYEIGSMYEKGVGIPKDINKAVLYYEKAGKHHDAMRKLVPIYIESKNKEQLDKALIILNQLKSGFSTSNDNRLFADTHYWLGRLHEINSKNDKAEEAYKFATNNIRFCQADGYYRLGMLYEVEGKTEESEKNYEMAAKRGHLEAAQKVSVEPKPPEYYLNLSKNIFELELPDSLKKDKDFIIKLIDKLPNIIQLPYVMELVDPALTEDKDFIMKIIDRDPFAGYRWAPLHLKRQKEVILHALTTAKAMEDGLKYDACAKLVTDSCEYKRSFENWINNDKDIVLALTLDKSNLRPSDELLNNTDFLKKIIEQTNSKDTLLHILLEWDKDKDTEEPTGKVIKQVLDFVGEEDRKFLKERLSSIEAK